MSDIGAITKTTPLRLRRAVELAWPDGGMTVSGLRREFARGNLVIERYAGKDFVTLAAIDDMRERCQDRRKAHTSGSGRKASRPEPESASRPPGLSATELNPNALDVLLAMLNEPTTHSQNTSSRKRAKHRPQADVIQIRS